MCLSKPNNYLELKKNKDFLLDCLFLTNCTELKLPKIISKINDESLGVEAHKWENQEMILSWWNKIYLCALPNDVLKPTFKLGQFIWLENFEA